MAARGQVVADGALGGPGGCGDLGAAKALPVYLMFNEGYSATGGSTLIRGSLVRSEIRLARLLIVVLEGSPQEPESLSLLALMLFHDARRRARTDAAGALVRLEEQDRGSRDKAAIAEAAALLAVADNLDISRHRGMPHDYL